jgi:mRNA-degrading endonuclease RelE of RelBE toxin-antitoxin system
MRHEISFAPEAIEDLKGLLARNRRTIRDAIESHLRHEPEKISQSRIKRLHDFRRPQYRLRVDDWRVFYDVSDQTVEILAIVSKAQASDWLDQFGERT